MTCPHCASSVTKEQKKKTLLGYRTFRCSACQRIFKERTGTPFNYLEYPTDIVLLVVLWRLRYKLSLRDLAEMFFRTWLCVHSRGGSRLGDALCSLACRTTTSQKTW